MSVSQLLVPNENILYCKSINQSTPITTGRLVTTNTTDASSATDANASLTTAGGAAIAKRLYVGTTATANALSVTTTSTLTGLTTATGGVQFATSGGTPDTLDFYETYTVSGSYNTTPLITVGSVTMRITRLGRLVSLYLPAGIGNQLNGAPTNMTFNQAIPTRFRPPASTNDTVSFPVNIIENNVSKVGCMLIVPSTGAISFYAGGSPVASQSVPGINWAATLGGSNKAGITDTFVSWQI